MAAENTTFNANQGSRSEQPGAQSGEQVATLFKLLNVTPVPEPSSLALLALGATLLLRRRSP